MQHTLRKILFRQSNTIVTYQPMARFATKGVKDKGVGDEKNFFTKEDQTALKNLLKKIHAQQVEVTQEAKEGQSKYDQSQAELKQLFKEHSVTYTEEFATKLLNWKYP